MSIYDPDAFAAFDARFNLTFRDPLLLRQAFVHRSYFNEHGPHDETLADNERLEFLGDAVLGFVVSELLYARYPLAHEGALTHLRTLLVRRETLAQMAAEMEMGQLLLLGLGEEDSGGRERLATLCACFEALIGSIFLDQGLPKVQEFLLPRVTAILDTVRADAMPKDPKSRFQEWAQLSFGSTPRYKVVENHGPDHAKTFVTVVSVKGHLMGVGAGHSKQDASQAAAAMALHRHGQHSPEYAADAELEERFSLEPLPMPLPAPPPLAPTPAHALSNGDGAALPEPAPEEAGAAPA